MASLLLIALLVVEPEFSVQFPQCDRRDQQTLRLASVHEVQLEWQLLSPGVLIEFWGSEFGTWTLLQTTPLGISCILQAGESEALKQGKPL